MSKKEAKAEKRRQKLKKKQNKLMRVGKFKLWRNRRPFWGATLTFLAGLLILYIPVQMYAIAFAPGSFAFVGLLFGGLILIIGALSYLYPQFSTVFGVMTIFLSVLSIMGALGGFIVGTLLGITGGSLLIAWRAETVPAKTDRHWDQGAKAIEGGKQQERYADDPERPKPAAATGVVYADETGIIAAGNAAEAASTRESAQDDAKREAMPGNREHTGSAGVVYADEGGIVAAGNRTEVAAADETEGAQPSNKRTRKNAETKNPGDVLNTTGSTRIIYGDEKRNA
ncbi:MAG TPA: DUF6114 domain-containing protein [Bacillales bacterium]|nr:DUF6114 domain-containing protein [Bacillales bacterium]